MPDCVSREIAVVTNVAVYRVVGPIPNRSFLTHVTLHCGGDPTSASLTAIALSPNRQVTAAQMAVSERLIDFGDTIVDEQPAIFMSHLGNTVLSLTIQINRRITKGPAWILVRHASAGAEVVERLLVVATFLTLEEHAALYATPRPVAFVARPDAPGVRPIGGPAGPAVPAL